MTFVAQPIGEFWNTFLDNQFFDILRNFFSFVSLIVIDFHDQVKLVCFYESGKHPGERERGRCKMQGCLWFVSSYRLLLTSRERVVRSLPWEEAGFGGVALPRRQISSSVEENAYLTWIGYRVSGNSSRVFLLL